MQRFLAAAFAVLCLALLAAPAQAFTVGCQQAGITGPVFQGLSREKNFVKLMYLRRYGETPLFTLLSQGGNPTALSYVLTLWTAINCAAIEDANPTAAQLRIRWAQAIGTGTDTFNATRAYDYYVERLGQLAPRLKNPLLSDADRQNILNAMLSSGELQLIADSFAWGATFDPQYAGGLAVLTQKLGLPPPAAPQ